MSVGKLLCVYIFDSWNPSQAHRTVSIYWDTRETSGTGGFSLPRTSNTENVSMSWYKAVGYPCSHFTFYLTHKAMDKITTIVQTAFSNACSSMEIFGFPLVFHWNIPEGPTDNKSSLVQVMLWRQTGDKPLPELMMTKSSDAYMRHKASMS